MDFYHPVDRVQPSASTGELNSKNLQRYGKYPQRRVTSRWKDVTQTQQQRPEYPTVTLTRNASKYKGYKVHRRYIPKTGLSPVAPFHAHLATQMCTRIRQNQFGLRPDLETGSSYKHIYIGYGFFIFLVLTFLAEGHLPRYLRCRVGLEVQVLCCTANWSTGSAHSENMQPSPPVARFLNAVSLYLLLDFEHTQNAYQKNNPERQTQ